MNLLEQIMALLKLHGVEAKGYDRIDVALDKLYKVEMAEYRNKVFASAPKAREERKPKKETRAEEEHLGI